MKLFQKTSLSGSLSLKELIRTYFYKITNNIRDPNDFKPFGFCVFNGGQGSGKSLSAVQYIDNLHKQYPRAIICTNMYLFLYFGLEEIDVLKFTEEEKQSLNTKARLEFYQGKKRLSKKEKSYYKEYKKQLDPINYIYSSIKEEYYKVPCWIYEYNGIDSLQNLQNDELGVIYFIDEFLTLFNSIKSKDMDLEDFEAICQLRKQHKRIVSCAQVFGRIAKGWREQVKEIILCKNFGGLLQMNSLIDGTEITDDSKRTGYTVKQRFFWFHTVRLYKAYDTYQVVRKDGFDGA